jgi:hypothetical protein
MKWEVVALVLLDMEKMKKENASLVFQDAFVNLLLTVTDALVKMKGSINIIIVHLAQQDVFVHFQTNVIVVLMDMGWVKMICVNRV